MSSINRRNALAIVVAGLPAGISGAAASHTDAGLIDLANRVIAAHQEAERAFAIEEALFGEYQKRKPERPSALRWRMADPVGFWTQRLPNGKGRLWCDDAKIDELRHKPASTKKFIGTAEDWAALPDGSNGPLTPEELEKCASFWADVPNPAKQKRLDEIIAAHDAYEAARTALKAEIGLDRAETVYAAADDRLWALAKELNALRAVTAEGIRAKARVMVSIWRDSLDDDNDTSLLEQATTSIIRDLVS